MKNTFAERSLETKTALNKVGGKTESLAPEVVSSIAASILTDMPAAVKEMEALRKGTATKQAVEVSLAQYAQDKWGFSPNDRMQPESLLECLGVNMSQTTVHQLWNTADFDEGMRWLVPEIFRAAIQTGLRKNPIYPSLIAMEETISQPSVVLPWSNMSEATPKKMNESESFVMGNVSFNQKRVEISKIGIGLSITDEVLKFSPVSILSAFLQDVGVKLGLALDTEAINTLIYGDQDDSTDTIAVVGTANGTSFAYADILKAWIRMSRMGRIPAGMLSNEDPAIDILQLAEFKGFNGVTKSQNLIVRTPVPETQNYFINGSMTDNDQVMFVDPTAALIKLNVESMLVESERIANKQINNTYASMRTGFATMFRDARLILDRSVSYGSSPFPSWFNPTELTNFK